MTFFPRSRSFWFGLTLPVQACKLILSKPVLIVLSLLPIGVTLSLYTYLIQKLQSVLRGQLVEYFKTWGWNPEGWVAAMVLVFSKLLFFLIGAVTFSFVSSIVSSPFNDFLAERTEKYTGLEKIHKQSLVNKLKLVGIDFLKTLAAMIAFLLAVLVSWIPVVGIISFVFAFLLIAFQYVSYPQTRRGQGLREGIGFLWKYFYACTGFGVVLTLLFSLPVVSSLSLPLAVVGGTLLFARSLNRGEEFRLK